MTAFKLDDSPKIQPGFKVPDGYFDTVPQQITDRIDRPVVPLYLKKKNIIYAAAAVLLLALMLPFYDAATTTADLDEATLENYLAYQSGISQYDLLTMMEPEDIAELNVELAVEAEVLEEMLSTADIEQLLIE